MTATGSSGREDHGFTFHCSRILELWRQKNQAISFFFRATGAQVRVGTALVGEVADQRIMPG